MNHSFVKIANSDKCRECGYNELAHGDSVQCESCPNIGAVVPIDKMLLCATCEARDIEIKAELAARTTNEPTDRISQLVNLFTGKEMITDSREYFVKTATSICKIEDRLATSGIENPKFELAKIVESRIKHNRNILFKIKKLELEMKIDSVCDQKYLNSIVPQLRAEEREAFKAYDISYKPSSVAGPAKVSGPRISASDRAMQSYADQLGITLEQARQFMEAAVKNTLGIKCVCAETPGMCKIHPNKK